MIDLSQGEIQVTTEFPQALEIMENLENQKKPSGLEKSWNLKKTLNNHGKIMEFYELIWRNHQ